MSEIKKRKPQAEASTEMTPVGDAAPTVLPGRRDPEAMPEPGRSVEILPPRPGEPIFGALADGMVALGWSVFPQTIDRKPGSVRGEMIKWSTDHDLINRLPTRSELAIWKTFCSPLNVALVMGPASGGVIAIDIDILDIETSLRVQILALNMLGRTPFRRVGSRPKIALLYRQAEGASVPSSSRRFAAEELAESGLEVLSTGKLLTVHGIHHKTGHWISWIDGDCSVATHGPEDLPVVTSSQVEAFIAAVNEVYPLKERTSSTYEGVAFEGVAIRAGVSAPKPKNSKGNWTEDQDGLVTNGRKSFLNSLAYGAALRSAHGVDHGELDGLLPEVVAAVISMFRESVARGGDYTDGDIAQRAERSIRKAFEQVREGKVQTIGRREALPRPAAGEAPFRALGMSGGSSLVFLRRGAAGGLSILPISRVVKLEGLLELAPTSYWTALYQTEKGKLDKEAAADALVSECKALGGFDPDRVRGPGTWVDEGRVVVHAGDHLVIDSQEAALDEIDSRFIYEGGPVMEKGDAVASGGELLLEVCNLLPLVERRRAPLLAGWLAVAPVCGAMTWRSHAQITGERGQGKSWFVDNVAAPALAGWGVRTEGSTTEAGIRQTLGASARPVLFDESETQSARDRDRMQNVMNFARTASSENSAGVLKGGAGGDARRYTARSSFLFSSINEAAWQAADASRMVTFEFRVSVQPEIAKSGFESLRKAAAGLTPTACAGIRARMRGLVHELRTATEVFAAAIAGFADRRTGDTFGVPAAGAWLLAHEEAPTAEEAAAFLEQVGLSGDSMAAREDTPEWRQALDVVLSALVETPIGVRQIGEVLGSADAAVLARAGVKVNPAGTKALVTNGDGSFLNPEEGVLLLAGGATGPLAALFEDTPWANSWRGSLLRCPGATKVATATRFGGTVHKPISIPLTLAV